MNRTIIYSSGVLAVLATSLVSCSESELEDFRQEGVSPVTVNAGSVAGEPVANNETIVVQWQVDLSGPAQKAFDIGVELNTDTVLALIAGGDLENTVALGGDDLVVPTHLKVPYGVESAVLEVQIGRTILERSFGKQVAFALRLMDPGKGNTIGKTTGLIVLNTADILTQEDLHYVSFENGGGGQLVVGNRQNYVVTSAGVQVPLNLSLSGSPSRSFSARAVLNSDTIAGLIDQGVLPANTIELPEDSYTLDTVAVMGGNETTAPLNLVIPWPTLEENVGSILTLAVDLVDPTRHVLHPENSRVIIVIDPLNVVESDVTADGTLSVSKDNNGGPGAGEGSPKVVDGNSDTKFLNEYSNDLWMKLEYAEPVIVRAYTLTSANDADTRDPKDWKLQGSNDGTTWTQLDSRSGETFSERFQTRRFDFDNSTAYKYYRIDITANNGSSLFQLAEWRLIRVP
ncbi:F5/8 type C domain-containing protein [Anseongella ginsenosidimutans]|uniref:F5/8 type C domain-containing protein n=1 Tax=Anseongella ginsenosidimutans TaxID=496056 RepID=A0A4R3KL68_9SPHI|nr:discoidin domain-containing protein [Anseongella ginsenosidimutans]QEC54002.1 discoidin domain-containing protein [Anseongella ginsenosidimutans]TCS84290.1 F5/8 type C domain-containing protein [Anseongella ginsenosidimutans]